MGSTSLLPPVFRPEELLVNLSFVGAYQEHAPCFFALLQQFHMKLQIPRINGVAVFSLSEIRRIQIHQCGGPVGKHCNKLTGISILNSYTPQPLHCLLKTFRQVVPAVDACLSATPRVRLGE